MWVTPAADTFSKKHQLLAQSHKPHVALFRNFLLHFNTHHIALLPPFISTRDHLRLVAWGLSTLQGLEILFVPFSKMLQK